MINPENPVFIPSPQERGKVPVYRDFAIVPRNIIKQTVWTMEMAEKGVVSPREREDYVQNHTYPFLKQAIEGSGKIFYKDLHIGNVQPAMLNEAAEYTNVVFGWMHYFAKSDFLPQGYSKRGVLKAPETPEEFIKRIKEIQIQLALLVSGAPAMGKRMDPAGVRAFNFFKVGSAIPNRFIESDRERKQYEQDVAARLLSGIEGL